METARSRKQRNPSPAGPPSTEALPPVSWDAAQLDAELGGRTSLEKVGAVVYQMKKALYERMSRASSRITWAMAGAVLEK